MRALAWLYLIAPQWAVRILPGRINHAEDGRFNTAVTAAYDRRVERQYRRLAK